MLAAGDTFRAAAVEQLKVWGDRAGVPVIAKDTGADAAGLAYDALERARDEGCDVLLIDTAGRLHNKSNLMDELAKIVRVIRKLDPTAPHFVPAGARRHDRPERPRPGRDLQGDRAGRRPGGDQARRHAQGGVLVALAESFKLPSSPSASAKGSTISAVRGAGLCARDRVEWG